MQPLDHSGSPSPQVMEETYRTMEMNSSLAKYFYDILPLQPSETKPEEPRVFIYKIDL